MKKLLSYISSLLLISAFFCTCSGPTSTIESIHHDDNYSSMRMKKIMVIGMGDKETVSHLFERKMKEQLEKKKVSVVMSYEVWPDKEEINKENFNKYFNDEGIDGVLVSSIQSRKLKPLLIPGEVYNYYEEHSNSNEETYVGMLEEVIIETRLFETKNEKQIWTCFSKTFKVEDAPVLAEDLAKLVVKNLKKEKLI